MAHSIDGKQLAAEVDADTAARVAQLRAEGGPTPGLVVVRVGEDPASEVYVRTKVRRAAEVGIASSEVHLPATASQQEVRDAIQRCNDDPAIHGILLQLPLPSHLTSHELIESIDPALDVDGFHSQNIAALAQGKPKLVACTPTGSMMLARRGLALRNQVSEDTVSLEGLHAVVVGRSQIVGWPLSQLLLQANCTVTVAHSRTRDLPATCREADLLFVAVGRPEFVRRDWVKPGAVVVDVGINRIDADNAKGYKLVGDAHGEEMFEVAGAYTPVPGGVGPMTVACLLSNAVQAAANLHAMAQA